MSRESTFLFNNLLLLASCFAVLWGTLFPVITETFTGERVSVDAPFFNRVETPIALVLLLLTGLGPLIAWRRSSLDSLRRAFLGPLMAGIVTGVALFMLGMRHFYALLSFALCTFVITTILLEFYKGSRVIRSKRGGLWVSAIVELLFRNTRRYGGYIVHLGIVLMFVGFTGSAFNQSMTAEIASAETIRLGHYRLRLLSVQSGQTSNYSWQSLQVAVAKDQKSLGLIAPERRYYFASQQPMAEVAIRRRLNEDLYLNFAGVSENGTKAILQVFLNPLVSWIWIGYFVVLFGTVICLIPSRSRLISPATEVVSVGVSYAEAAR